MSYPNTTFEVVSPIGEPAVKVALAASRIPDLNGKTVCEVWNGMFRGDVVLTAVSELLKKRFPKVKIVPWKEMPIAVQGWEEKSLADIKAAYIAKGCDAVISATGG